jgi:hypothetical protein
MPKHSLPRLQELRQLRAVGNLRLNLQETRHEIHDPYWNRDHKETQQSQDEQTSMPFISCDFVHATLSVLFVDAPCGLPFDMSGSAVAGAD